MVLSALSIMVLKAWQQEEGEAVHIVATGRKQGAMNNCVRSAFFLLLSQPGEHRTRNNIIHI